MNANNSARQSHLERSLFTLAKHGERNLRIGRTAHAFDSFVERHALNRDSVDGGNEITGLDARALGRRIVDRRDDFNKSVFGTDFDSEAAKLAAGRHLHIFEVVRVHIAGVRIKMRDHAVDRGIDQLRVLDFAHIICADTLKGISKEIKLPVSR